MKYELDKLGWSEFETLCQTLTKLRLGFAVEAWGATGDWGRDAYYEGALNYPTKVSSKGPFVFQAKFVNGANSAGADSDTIIKKAIGAESTRISKRLESPKKNQPPKWPTPPKHYSLMTNAPTRPKLREWIKERLARELPDSHIHIHSGDDICSWIAAEKSIIQAFPQLFTIMDWEFHLLKTINAGVLQRSSSALRLAENAAKNFVITKAYDQTLRTLARHNFAVLEGPPEMGKTTIARVIGASRVASNWEVIECRNPKEIHESRNQNRDQLIIADDCFGRTEYDPSWTKEWQSELPHILPFLSTKRQLIFTSRAHILKEAKKNLDISDHNHIFPDLGEVIVTASKLSTEEKAKMLYRHAKNASLNTSHKDSLKQVASQIIYNKHFTPLRIKNFIRDLSAES